MHKAWPVGTLLLKTLTATFFVGVVVGLEGEVDHLNCVPAGKSGSPGFGVAVNVICLAKSELLVIRNSLLVAVEVDVSARPEPGLTLIVNSGILSRKADRVVVFDTGERPG